MEKEKIEVKATIKGSTEKIWRYYTQPIHIMKWNFANNDWSCPHAENDLRVGGHFTYRMEAKQGQQGFDFEGTYDEVEDQEKIAYTLEDDREIIVTFERLGEHTLVTVAFDADKEHSRQQQQEGWQAILDNFKDYVESN